MKSLNKSQSSDVSSEDDEAQLRDFKIQIIDEESSIIDQPFSNDESTIKIEIDSLQNNQGQLLENEQPEQSFYQKSVLDEITETIKGGQKTKKRICWQKLSHKPLKIFDRQALQEIENDQLTKKQADIHQNEIQLPRSVSNIFPKKSISSRNNANSGVQSSHRQRRFDMKTQDQQFIIKPLIKIKHQQQNSGENPKLQKQQSQYFQNRYYSNNFLQKEADEGIQKQIVSQEKNDKFKLQSLIPDLLKSIIKDKQRYSDLNMKIRHSLDKSKWKVSKILPEMKLQQSKCDNRSSLQNYKSMILMQSADAIVDKKQTDQMQLNNLS
ncbi:UNKNOWN [Stylonychia lemnae]|uniref:Uncharacterized protein n=1 Tax=Stylonychia lemnae TaxID=5949 RepID=A0A078ANM0_STYLE|nr:UNKNOWN [Stylonychia lemnae]|eukprot:CDW83531.1 UNKNOWN [Stylonychia lemnae]